MRLQLIQLRTACSDGETARTDGPATRDIQGGVANDEDFVAAQIAPEQAAAPRVGNAGDFVAVLVVVAKAAGDEGIPQAVVAEFDLRAEADVAGEQAEERRVGECGEFGQPFARAGTRPASKFAEMVFEPEDVGVAEALKVFRRGRDAMQREELADEAGVRAARETHLLGAVRQAKLGGECAPKRSHTRTTGVQQRAVNVEED